MLLRVMYKLLVLCTQSDAVRKIRIDNQFVLCCMTFGASVSVRNASTLTCKTYYVVHTVAVLAVSAMQPFAIS
jgi:hypothetical protein